MKTFEVNYFNPSTCEIETVNMTTEDIARNPSGLRMADVGFALLNEKREELGLKPIPRHWYNWYAEEENKLDAD